MSYFSRFATKAFQAHDKVTYAVTDIITAIQIPEQILADRNLYFTYRMEDGETPEMVSYRIYKSTAYHWVIMAINRRYDVWEDFPKSDYIIRKRIVESGFEPDAIHHYEKDSRWVDQFEPLAASITHIEYQYQLNEEKRIIRVLKPEFLSEFVDFFFKLIES